ncbi:hypothetical protein [Nostoc sp. 'Peltigera membranacea cyanobiont' 232]|uniref:hypothetical protein n=1 Tax=Nostoc sp. 'Peltigera membranacea cyanobiont' 232 TaxID=2014531 RepID=UPI00167B1A6F|nr:hypothetical protein [Nostoc sp. 'Peltigera membranacea cyanobiont' 232]
MSFLNSIYSFELYVVLVQSEVFRDRLAKLSFKSQLGYKNNSYLYRYFPELSRSISKHYQEYNNAIGKKKRELVCQEIQNVAQLLHSQGQKPTQRRVTQLLTKPGVMRNLWVRSYLREIQQSFGYD